MLRSVQVVVAVWWPFQNPENRPMSRIGQTLLKTLAGVTAKTVVFDDELAGFGIVARPGGRVTYIVDYRPHPGGRTAPKRRWTIATKAETTPEKARKAALDIIARVRLGQDPVADRQRAREGENVGDLADAFMKERSIERGKGRAKLKPATAASYGQTIRTWIKPRLGSRKAVDVRRADITKLHTAIVEGRGGARDAKGKLPPGGPAVANRAVAVLSAMFAWGERQGVILPENHPNPAKGVERSREIETKRYLDEDELGRLADALTRGETDGLPWNVDRTKPGAKHMRKDAEDQRVKISLHVASVIRLLIFTGARRNEIVKLRWDEVKIDQGLLELKDSKTGPKTIILNPPAIAILADLSPVGPYVFPSGTDPLNKPMDNFNKAWAALIRAAALPGLRIHDLRHTFGSTSVSLNESLPMTGRLLGHRSNAATQRYARVAIDPAREASTRVGLELARRMAGGRPSPDDAPGAGDNVVQLKPARRGR